MLIKNIIIEVYLYISTYMNLMVIDEKYCIVDNDTVIMTANSTEELYSKALQILHAFESPVTNTVPTPEQTQQAIDLLTS